MVDDGCTDGTREAVKQQFPEVRVIEGNGNLYWCGGMRLAWDTAMVGEYDYYLWLNDDTTLVQDALETLIVTEQNMNIGSKRSGVVIGSTLDPTSGMLTYGGFANAKARALVVPTDCPQSCYTCTGNIVLVPRIVAKKVGNLSPEFLHTHGDMDYGLRTRKKGFNLWVAPQYQGYCSKHVYAPWCDPSVSIAERWKSLHTPKGQPPYETYIYAKRHTTFWPIALIKLYLRVLFPKQWEWLKGKRAYFKLGISRSR